MPQSVSRVVVSLVVWSLHGRFWPPPSLPPLAPLWDDVAAFCFRRAFSWFSFNVTLFVFIWRFYCLIILEELICNDKSWFQCKDTFYQKHGINFMFFKFDSRSTGNHKIKKNSKRKEGVSFYAFALIVYFHTNIVDFSISSVCLFRMHLPMLPCCCT